MISVKACTVSLNGSSPVDEAIIVVWLTYAFVPVTLWTCDSWLHASPTIRYIGFWAFQLITIVLTQPLTSIPFAAVFPAKFYTFVCRSIVQILTGFDSRLANTLRKFMIEVAAIEVIL